MFSDLLRAGLICATVWLAACAPRGEIDFATPGPEVVATSRSVFVATNRQPDEGGGFREARDGATHFARYDISIPAARQPGEINWPRRRAVDPATDFVTTHVDRIENATAMRRALRAALAARPPTEREVVVFVHGYNNTFAEGLYRTAQLGHDFGTKGVLVHFSWPSAGSALNYAYDRDSMLFARAAFAEFVGLLREAGARNVVIVAHSMGAMLTMEALVRLDLSAPGAAAGMVRSVALISPDIDPSVFLSQAASLRRLPEEFVILTSSKDRALRLSALVGGQPKRLGNIEEVGFLSELDITVLDVTEFSSGGGHFDLAQSAALIALLSQVSAIDSGFQQASTNTVGLLPAIVLRVQQATRVILLPTPAGAEQGP